MRTIDFADGFSTDTVPSITGVTYTDIEFAGTLSTSTSNSAISGSNAVVIQPTTEIVRLTNGALVSISDIQNNIPSQQITITNATGNAITINNNVGATAAYGIKTGSGANISLADEASLILKYDNTEARWMVVGGTGSGSGSSANYITNSDAEAGTTGYLTYADAAGVNPVDATGGTASVTFTDSSSSPLFGIKSFLLSKGATNRQGDGVAYAYTLSAGDATQVLTLTLPYSTTTNYVDGDIRVGIYDVTNAQIIEGTQRDLAANANGFYVSSFQMPSNSTSFRVFWHISSTNASAYDVKFDQVSLEKKPVVKGPIVTDWISYTPVVTNMGTGSTSSLSGKWRRSGDSAEVEIYAVKDGSSGTGTSNVTFTLPFTPDTNKLTNGITNGQKLGAAEVSVSGVGFEPEIVVLWAGADKVIIADAGTNQGFRGDDFLSSTIIQISVKYPIVGWSSNVVLSEDTGNRVVAMIAGLTGAQSFASAAALDLVFNSASYDTTGSLNTSTGIWTCPESGFYNTSSCVRFGSLTVGEMAYVYLIKNSSTIAMIHNSSDVANDYVHISKTEYLNRGDTLKVQVSSTIDTSYAVSATTTSWQIFKIQTPQSIGQSEVVNCKYYNSATNHSVADSTDVYLDFATKDFDTHGAVLGNGSGAVTTTNTGWRFICPQSGKYEVHAIALYTSVATWASGERSRLYVYKNGSAAGCLDHRDSSITTGSPQMANAGIAILNCVKGDRLEIVINQTSASTQTINAAQLFNYVEIKKVG